MRLNEFVLTQLAVGLAFALPSAADTINWGTLQRTLGKPDYNQDTATHQVTSEDGIGVSMELRHLGTTPDRFSYSKWEIDQWGDPLGFYTEPGSWQMVTGIENDVVLGLWGYWGSGSTPLQNGDSTAYVLEMVFDEPVSNLSFPINGIDAYLSADGGNAQDQILVTAFLEATDRTETLEFSSLGASVDLVEGSLVGDSSAQMGSQSGFYPVSDEGTALVSIVEKVSRVEIVIVNYAVHPDPAQFSDSVQNWSISLGDLEFESDVVDLGRVTVDWAPDQGALEKEGYNQDSASFTTTASNGTTQVTFDLNHVVTTGDKFGYSRWEINRWGDPDGVVAQLGSWQVPSNAANDVVLAPWGFWGNDGSPGSEPTEIGDIITYQLIMGFSEPVTDLTFALNSIDSVLSDGFNSIDQMDLRSFLGGVAKANPVSAGRWGQLPVVDGRVQGEFPESGQTEGIAAMSDDGTVQLCFPEPVDQVDLTFTTTADHPTPSAFVGGTQNWSFSVSDLSFLTGTPTAITWDPLRTTLFKEPFDQEPGTYAVVSDDGEVTATLEMEHLGTTDDKFGYWKWEIDRWGDPDGISTPEPGGFQVVTNQANDVVFGVWGYWGTDGSAGSPPVNVDDEVAYRFSVVFDRPVKNLDFSLNGINGFLKPIDGFNSQDIVTIAPSLDGVPQGSPVYSEEGDAFIRDGNVLTGDYDTQIVGEYGGQHVSDQGSIQVRLGDTVDRVDITIVNKAGHNNLAEYQDGLQTISFSLGDLRFTYE